MYSNPEEKAKEEKDETVLEQIDTSSKKRKRKKKIKINSPNVKFINTDNVSKKKIMNIAENNAENNSHSNKNDERDAQDKNVVNKNEKRKRENKLRDDGNSPDGNNPKKMKTHKAGREDSRIKTDNVNINVENNGKIASLSAEKSTIVRKKNKNKNSQLNKAKIGKRKSNNDDPMMSLGTERLKAYGISAKKFKNKLKYGNKKL